VWRHLSVVLPLAALLLGTGLGVGLGLSEAPSSEMAPVQQPQPSSTTTTATAPLPEATTEPTTTTIPAPQAVSATVQLPPGIAFSEISVTASGGLRLSGTVGTSGETSAPSCVIAMLDPVTLVLSTPSSIDCNDPAFYGEQSYTVDVRLDQPNPGGVGLAVTTLDPATGQSSQGPVVMAYQQCSDCDPVTASYGGLLWIYCPTTTNGAELLEVSTASGQVLDTVAMPKIFRPFMAANAEGVFVASSLYGGSGPALLYYVAPGGKAPVTLNTDPWLAACWMQAEGEELWIGMGSTGTGGHGCGQVTIWRFTGTNPQPDFEVPAVSGYIPPVVGGEAEGLWTVRWPYRGALPSNPLIPQLIYINPDTGLSSVVADLPPISGPGIVFNGMQPGEAVLLDGALYLLEPPTVAGGGGYGVLIRVNL
jgi:hypothetical protein